MQIVQMELVVEQQQLLDRLKQTRPGEGARGHQVKQLIQQRPREKGDDNPKHIF